ncbi:MAG: hypothetical protein E6G12_06050 [Actinobacteria bacterium]|nr:MAG: hypothetical protein E6G12_06050 [Actinomycetota bacterium]
MPKPVPGKGPRLGYRPGLDGLRAIAVAAVFLYHARPHADGNPWLPGGFLGVDLFFVLSGYLITSLLLVEWDARNRIDLRRFWMRRARRLLPALVVVVLAALILAAIFARDDLARTRGDAVSSLLYYTNWHLIVANHSYFNLMGRPSLLQHLWSLAVEEQFYVIWPLLLVPGLVLVGRKRLPFLVVAGIAGSAALMWLLYNPADPSRVWYGTDTRAFLLLMGILLALVWPAIERMRRSLPLLELRRPRRSVLLRRVDRGSCPSPDRDRASVRGGAVALGRREELRHLPLAFPGRRAHAARSGHPVDGAGRRRGAGCDRPLGGGAVVSLRRAADPDGKPAAAARPAVAPASARARRRRGDEPRRRLGHPLRDPEGAEPRHNLRSPAGRDGGGQASAHADVHRADGHRAKETVPPACGPDPRARRLGDARLHAAAEGGPPPPCPHRRDSGPADRGHGPGAQPSPQASPAAGNGRDPGREQRTALVPRPRQAAGGAARHPGHRFRQRPQRHQLAGRVEPRAR